MSNHDGQKRDHRCRTSRRHQPPEVPWHATCHRQRKIASTDPITRESHSTNCRRLATEQEPMLGMSQPRIPRPQISSPDVAWATVAMAWVSGEWTTIAWSPMIQRQQILTLMGKREVRLERADMTRATKDTKECAYFLFKKH